jgi:hypothetical protein
MRHQLSIAEASMIGLQQHTFETLQQLIDLCLTLDANSKITTNSTGKKTNSGNYSPSMTEEPKLFCTFCKTSTHNTESCRRKAQVTKVTSGGADKPSPPSTNQSSTTEHQKNRVLQCWRCGGNHLTKGCKNPVKCYHCSGEHYAHKCSKHASTP